MDRKYGVPLYTLEILVRDSYCDLRKSKVEELNKSYMCRGGNSSVKAGNRCNEGSNHLEGVISFHKGFILKSCIEKKVVLRYALHT